MYFLMKFVIGCVTCSERNQAKKAFPENSGVFDTKFGKVWRYQGNFGYYNHSLLQSSVFKNKVRTKKEKNNLKD